MQDPYSQKELIEISNILKFGHFVYQALILNEIQPFKNSKIY